MNKNSKKNVNEKCKNCNMLTYITHTFNNIKKLDSDECYYTCVANIENDCIQQNSVYDKTKYDLIEELQELINKNNNLEYDDCKIENGNLLYNNDKWEILDLKAMNEKELIYEIQKIKDNI
jgi:hypothetical protein